MSEHPDWAQDESICPCGEKAGPDFRYGLCDKHAKETPAPTLLRMGATTGRLLKHESELTAALAAARRECEVMRGAVRDLLDVADRNRAGYPIEQERWYAIRDAARALIPPAAVPERQRDTPCGACGHPLWWHQWDSKEHAFCCAPLDDLRRDYCQCRNYEKPAAAPAAAQMDAPTGPVCGCGKPSRYESGWCGETHCFNPAPAAETWKAQGAEAENRACDKALIEGLSRNRETWIARAEKAEKRIAELERALELAYPFVAEGDEGTEVDGLPQEQIVARINKVMRAAHRSGT